MQRGRKSTRTKSTDSAIQLPTEHDSLLGEASRPSHSYDATTVHGSDTCSDHASTEIIDIVIEEETWWWWPSALVLENSQSVARDHLASERTFLAYVRTSLAVVSAGVALSQLLLVQMREFPSLSIGPFASLLGAACVTLGICILYQGSTRYFTVQSALIDGKFPVARFGATAISVALGMLVATTFIVLVIYQKNMIST